MRPQETCNPLHVSVDCIAKATFNLSLYSLCTFRHSCDQENILVS